MRPRLHQKLKNRVKVSASVRLVIAVASVTLIVGLSFLIYNLVFDSEDTFASSDENKLIDFSYRIPLQLDKSFLKGQEIFLDEAIAVVLQHEDFRSIQNGGKIMNANEPDFAFTKKDGISSLPYEVENYDPVKGKLTAWLLFDSLHVKMSDSLYIYYSSVVPRKISKHAAMPKDLSGRWHFNKNMNAWLGQVQTTKVTGTKNMNGVLAGAKLFDATEGDMSSINYHQNMNNEESFTLSVWIKPMQKSGKQIVVSTFDDMGGGYYLSLNEKKQPEFVFNALNNKTINSLQNKTEQLSIDNWHHLAVVVDYKSLMMTVYINGVPDKTTMLSAAMKPSAIGMMFGKRHFDEKSTLSSAIDELQIYNSAKSSIWVSSMFSNQSQADKLFITGFPEKLEVTDSRAQNRSKESLNSLEEMNDAELAKQYKLHEKMINAKVQQLKAKSSNPEEIQARLDHIKKVANSEAYQN